MLCSLHAGAALWKKDKGCNPGVVIEGELLLTVDGTDYYILQGDAFCFKSNRSHRYSNPGQITTEIVSVITPPTY